MKKVEINEIYDFSLSINNGKLIKSKRGLNIQFGPIYIEDTTDNLWEYIKNNVSTELFNKTYAEYINFREMSEESLNKIANSPWWTDDAKLLDKYIKLWKKINNIVNNYKNNKYSKNNVAYQEECCYSCFTIGGDLLQVCCRSSDMYFGIRSDIIVFTLLAKELNIPKMLIIMQQPHFYINTKSVARRKEK